MTNHSDFLVFADESGDHGLTNVNPSYPVFVLSCCIFDKNEYVQTVCPGMQRFKMQWWPHDAVVLHSSQIKRQEPPFLFLKSQEKRELFMQGLNELLDSSPFTLVSGVIHKTKLQSQYATPENPYALALQFCMERVYAFLKDRGQKSRDTTFLVERRGKVEDAELELVFRRVCDGANRWGKMPSLSIEFVDKKANLPGLQIADLVSTPIGRHVLRPEQPNRAFEIVQRKFRRSSNGDYRGYGFKVFP